MKRNSDRTSAREGHGEIAHGQNECVGKNVFSKAVRRSIGKCKDQSSREFSKKYFSPRFSPLEPEK